MIAYRDFFVKSKQDSQDSQDEQEKRLPFTYVFLFILTILNILNILLSVSYIPRSAWGFGNGKLITAECIGEIVVCPLVSYQRRAETEKEQGTQQEAQRFAHEDILLLIVLVTSGFGGFELKLR